MKNILVIFILFCSITVFSQNEISVKEPVNHEFKCDLVRFDTECNVMEIIGNVSFKTDIIEFEGAEMVVFDQNTQEILVTGISEFTFDGAIQVDTGTDMKTLRYTLGEKIAYVE